jgi:hypothetical protein
MRPGSRQRLLASEDNGLAQHHRCHHRGQHHQVVLVAERAVLTQQADHLRLELGVGRHGRLVWSANLNLPLLPAHPNGVILILSQDFLIVCQSARPEPLNQDCTDLWQQTMACPASKVSAYRRTGREVMGHGSPLNSIISQMENSIDNFSKIHPARAAHLLDRREKIFNSFPLFIGESSRMSQAIHTRNCNFYITNYGQSPAIGFVAQLTHCLSARINEVAFQVLK